MIDTLAVYGRVMHEKYRVKKIDEVKCWTILRFEGGSQVPLRRLYTDRDLVEKVVGEEVEVSRIEHPPLPNSMILNVFYKGKSLYSINPQIYEKTIRKNKIQKP